MQPISSAISPSGIHVSNIALPWDTVMPDLTKADLSVQLAASFEILFAPAIGPYIVAALVRFGVQAFESITRPSHQYLLSDERPWPLAISLVSNVACDQTMTCQ
jgi:hypothetical protein